MPQLDRGDLPPKIVHTPPGPRARALAASLALHEAPGINTLAADQTAMLWQEACGANVLDVDGNTFIDLTSGFGVAAVGHRHPRVVAAVRHQSERLLHGLADVYAHPGRLELAARLAACTPFDNAQVYFAISGADAVEIALKTATLATGRTAFLAFDPAYHGLTLGALAVSSRPDFRQPFEALLPRAIHRLPFGCPLGQVAETLAREPIAAVVAEPIVGREGVLLPPPSWLDGLSALCKEHGALFVADEIFTGFGRTGAWFASEEAERRPDLLCCGKALGGGLPIAATVGRPELLRHWERDGEALHTATFVAHPLACAAALAVLDILESEALVARAARLGALCREELDATIGKLEEVIEIRGRGLLWAVELDRATVAKGWAERATGRGLIVLAGGPRGNVVQVAPPLSITEEQLRTALSILAESLQETLGESKP